MHTHEKQTLQSLLKQAEALIAHALGIALNAGEAELTRKIKEIANLIIDVLNEMKKPPKKG